MGFMQRIKERFGNIPVSALPKTGGRSSVDQVDFNQGLTGIKDYYGAVQPEFPLQIMDVCSLLAIFNPDFSHHLKNLQGLVNTGHTLVVSDPSKPRQKKALSRLNEKAAKWYQINAGVDGLFNHLITQAATTGPACGEAQLDDDLKGVKTPILVPARTIRFKKEEGEWRPYQKVGGMSNNLIPLNPYTFKYYALARTEKTPYAIPPYAAALGPAMTQNGFMNSLDKVGKKLSLLGVEEITVKPPRKRPGESIKEHEKRTQEFVDEVAKRAKINYDSGILVHLDSQQHKHYTVVGNANGFKEIFHINEEQFCSALGTMGLFLGRSFNITDAFARVVYYLLTAQAKNFQNIIKRFIEDMYRLDLQLAGMGVEKISIKFDPPPSLAPNIEELAKRYKLKNVLDEVQWGVVDPDEGAGVLGHSGWYDKSKLEAKVAGGGQASFKTSFRWNSDLNMYEIKRPVLARLSQDEEDKKNAEQQDKVLKKNIRNYLSSTLPYWDKLKDDVVEFCFKFCKENYEDISQDARIALDAVVKYINAHPAYKNVHTDTWFTEKTEEELTDIYRYYKVEDQSIFPKGYEPSVKFHFGDGDRAAAKFFSKVDRYYFSSFLDNEGFGGEIKEFLTKFIKTGEAAHGNWTDEIKADFKRKFGHALSGDFERQFARIVSSSVTRISEGGHFSQYKQAGIKTATIVAILDGSCTSGVCPEMNGKKIPVDKAFGLFEEFANAVGVESALEWIKKTSIKNADDAKKDIDVLIAAGMGLIPFHPECRCKTKGDVEV
jgi:hypothetical protein